MDHDIEQLLWSLHSQKRKEVTVTDFESIFDKTDNIDEMRNSISHMQDSMNKLYLKFKKEHVRDRIEIEFLRKQNQRYHNRFSEASQLSPRSRKHNFGNVLSEVEEQRETIAELTELNSMHTMSIQELQSKHSSQEENMKNQIALINKLHSEDITKKENEALKLKDRIEYLEQVEAE